MAKVAQELADRVREDLREIENAHRAHFDLVKSEFDRAGVAMDAEVASLRDELQTVIEADRFGRRVRRIFKLF